MISMLWKSFYDAGAYLNALKNWRWKFLLYFLLLCAVFSAVASAALGARINSMFFRHSDQITSQIPDGRIKDGVFTMSVPSPHFVKLEDGRNFMAFSTGLLDSNQTDGLFMSVEKDRITMYVAPGDERYFFFSEIEGELKKAFKDEYSKEFSNGIPVNSKVFSDVMPLLKVMTFIMLPFMVFVFSLLMFFIMALSLSLPVFILSLTTLPRLGYFGALKISLLAMTPAAVFFAVEMCLGYGASGGFIYMILCLVIAWRVMRAMRATGLWQNPSRN